MPDPAPPGSEATASDTMGEFLDTAITRPRAGTAVLEVEGEVDTLTAPRFSSAVDELAVLIQAAHRAEDRSARLRLVAATRAVRRPLEITGTDQLFDMHENVHDATGGDD